MSSFYLKMSSNMASIRFGRITKEKSKMCLESQEVSGEKLLHSLNGRRRSHVVANNMAICNTLLEDI